MKSNEAIVSILACSTSFTFIPFYTLSFSSALSLVSHISLAYRFTFIRVFKHNFMIIVSPQWRWSRLYSGVMMAYPSIISPQEIIDRINLSDFSSETTPPPPPNPKPCETQASKKGISPTRLNNSPSKHIQID